jgi:6-phosphogluconolactonase
MTTGGPPVTTRVYVANADSHDIVVLAPTPDGGALTELQRFAAGGPVMPLAASPDRRVLHASLRSEPWTVHSLAIEPQTGRLAEIGRAPLPASMCWISTDRSGRWLLSASYGSSLVAVSPIGADGAVGAAQQVVATEPNAHAVQADPSNRWALASCLGGGVVRVFGFDAASGRLDEHAPRDWPARPGAGPRHFVFHPTLPLVYLLNELDAGVDVLAFDAARGRLAHRQTVSALPPGFTDPKPWAADLHLTPDGRFLYASERRSSTLAAFAVDGASGRLAPLGSVPTEAQPRGFAVTPDGRCVLAVGQVSGGLSRHAIGADGRLATLGRQPVGANPNWVEVVVLPG